MKSVRSLLVALLPVTLSAAEPTRIYLANDDHTDFMWTADADAYARVFVEMLDWHLKLADETAANPSAFRHRFNTDGALWLATYEQRKTPAEFARLIARLKDGTISVPLNTIVSCFGGQPVEAVLRGMYYAGRLERRFDLRFPLAIAMENQTLPLGLASLFAGAGARYSWRGVCGCASKLDHKLLGQRPHEIYWWTGLDGQRVLLKWHSLAPAGNQHSGGYAEAFDPVAAVQFLESDRDFLRRYRAPGDAAPYRVRGAFGFGWDALDRKTGQPYLPEPKKYPLVEHFHTVAEKQTNEQRQVIVSNQVDFFADFERTHGATLPSQTVTYGNEWDLYSASMSETSARAKRAVEKLRAAELLATFVSLKNPDFLRRHAAARDRAFTAMGLFWEHNWTADGPIARGHRAAWQESIASEIEYYVNSVHAEALLRLAGMIPRPENANRFFVFNPLGWTRTDAADFAYTGAAAIHVREVAGGAIVPHQLVKLAGAPRLRILARDVPSAGYKVYEIVAGVAPGAASLAPAAEVTRGEGAFTFENSAVKLVVERDGAISSFVDKRRGGRELAATIDGLAFNDLASDSAEGEPLRVENVGPVSVTLCARSEAGLDHATAITLYRDSDRIDVRNEIHANFADVRHWAFSFNLAAPAVRTEEVGAINLNQRASQGGAYADALARYDYLTLNHFADISAGDDAHGVTLSNADLAFARLGRSTATELDTTTPQINPLAGGQVDGTQLGIRSQNGATYFLQRFALRPHGGYDPASAMKFALEHQNPLVTAGVLGGKTAAYPADVYSLISVEKPHVLLWAVKPAEEGIDHGVIARLWNVSDSPAAASVSFAPGLATAHRTTHVETDLEPVALAADATLPARFARQHLQTYRLLPSVQSAPP